MPVKRVELLSQIVVALDKGFIAVSHTIKIALEAFCQKVQILNSLVTHTSSVIEVLVLNNLVVFLTEESLLKFNRLGIDSSNISDLEVKSLNSRLNLVTLSQDSVKFPVCLVNVETSLVDGLVKATNSLV